MSKVKDYILSHYDECIKENKTDNGSLIGLPYPYTVPAVGHFCELYYWDTYFINKGLLVVNRVNQAKNNTLDMCYLIEKYGYMPNGNKTYYIGRSQPPFLSEMVRDIYMIDKDINYLKTAYSALKKEYSHWMLNRISPVGFNIYGGKAKEGDDYLAVYKNRVGAEINENPEDIANHCILCCESGWDMNPRWQTEGYNYAPVDLNSLMYTLEVNLAYFAKELKNNEEDTYINAAKERKNLMAKYMKNENGVYYDYNFKTKKLSPILSAASFYPLFANAVTKSDASNSLSYLLKLETDYGILTCEKNDAPGTYQWDYPNGWPCLQYMAVKGLLNYGFVSDAERIATKFINLVDKVFEKNNNLWEKYNVKEGNINVSNEYEMPPMMGWTAGVYLVFESFLKNKTL